MSKQPTFLFVFLPLIFALGISEIATAVKFCEHMSQTWTGKCDNNKCDKKCIEWEKAIHGACHSREGKSGCFCYFDCAKKPPKNSVPAPPGSIAPGDGSKPPPAAGGGGGSSPPGAGGGGSSPPGAGTGGSSPPAAGGGGGGASPPAAGGGGGGSSPPAGGGSSPPAAGGGGGGGSSPPAAGGGSPPPAGGDKPCHHIEDYFTCMQACGVKNLNRKRATSFN
ncbi:unnamed protein product [Lactuca virosa]|uniref:Knottins-like domain-containing protein n=1 Tax=Lactuca virosa TaxID=75947 RepID=A0AAU9PJX5_9ASTR|nr:unnamed protein product [Lactuca virosa]